MREIKFRAKYKENKEWSYFTLKDLVSEDGLLFDNYHNWCQFTGLHDKNRKEIYDGDIVKFDTTDLKTKKLQHKFINTVRYDYCRFVVTDPSNDVPYCIYDVRQHLEVIGNIYENPDLLINWCAQCENEPTEGLCKVCSGNFRKDELTGKMVCWEFERGDLK